MWLPLTWPPKGDPNRNPGICPEWELNQWPFGSQAGAQSTEPHQPGQEKCLYWKETEALQESLFFLTSVSSSVAVLNCFLPLGSLGSSGWFFVYNIGTVCYLDNCSGVLAWRRVANIRLSLTTWQVRCLSPFYAWSASLASDPSPDIQGDPRSPN